MLKKLGFTLLCALSSASAINTQALAVTTHALQSGVSMEYEIPPQEPQVFVNFMFWSIQAQCKIDAEDENSEITAELLQKKGSVNNIELMKGNAITLNLHDDDILSISAESGAKVQITNLGDHMIKAICSS